MTNKPSERADRHPGDDKDDVPEHIQRLYDAPQERWSVEQWRDLSLYLLEELQCALASAHRANASHESTLGVATQLLADNKKGVLHAKLLRLLENGVADGTIKVVVKPPRKKPGAPKKLTPKVAAAIVVLAQRHGPKKAAETLAGWQLKNEGLSPIQHRTTLSKHTKTWANKVAPAKRMVAADIVREHGVGLQTFELQSRFGLLPKRRKQKK